MTVPVAGWYPDPAGSPQWRWWDGVRWGALAPVAAQQLPPQPAPVLPQPVALAQTRAAARVAAGATNIPTPIYLPELMVESAMMLPTVCVRHGRPAVRTRKVSFRTPTEWWLVALVFVSILIALVVLVVREVRVSSRAWPVCSECTGIHKSRLQIGWGLLVAAPILIWTICGFASLPGWLGSLLGLLSMCGGVVYLHLASWSVIVGGQVDRNTRNVLFKNPAPAFVAALPDRSALTPAPPIWGATQSLHTW